MGAEYREGGNRTPRARLAQWPALFRGVHESRGPRTGRVTVT
jgi:hypothetical protein